MNRLILANTVITGISVLGLAGCGGSSPAASAQQAVQMSPEQQLATALTGMTADNGATIESATVGLMCSGSYRAGRE